MSELATPVLVEYAERFLADEDFGPFCQHVREKYSESTLCRLVEAATSDRVRRAAVLALGITGSFDCNDVVAAALHDPDSSVRRWAEQSLWLIWFRGDDLETSIELKVVTKWLARNKPGRAVEWASQLISKSPDFAEAYNQRAIGYWRLGAWDRSIADCRKVLELNPNHFGAAAGMGQSYLQKDDRGQAIDSFQRALKINPNLSGVAEMLQDLRHGES